MPTFVLTYRNQIGYAPSPESTAAWMAWFDSMREQLVDRGKPVIDRSCLGNCATDSTQLGGYTLISADDLDGALRSPRAVRIWIGAAASRSVSSARCLAFAALTSRTPPRIACQ